MSRTPLSFLKASWPLATFALAASLSLGACTDKQDSWPSQYTASISSALSVVPSCDALDDARVDVVVNQIIANHQYVYDYDYDYGTDDGAPMPDAPSNGQDAEGPDDYTDTNLQEQGVDEADIVKFDGKWMYVVDGFKLRVFDSFPQEETSLTTIVPIRGADAELFLIKDPDRLVVMSRLYSTSDLGGCSGSQEECFDMGVPMLSPPESGFPRPESDMSATLLEIYDIQAPSDPQLVREVELEGDRITARIVNGQLYLVHTMSDYNQGVKTYEIGRRLKLDKRLPKDPAARAAALHFLRDEMGAAVRAEIKTSPTTLLPRYRVDGEDATKPIFGCERFYAPESKPNHWTSLNILALNLRDDASTPNGVGVLANGGHVYASQNSIYIARDSRSWLWIENQLDVVSTDIHAFALENGFPDYTASGRVEGYTRDRFTMSEKDDIFRIATTDQENFFWGGGDIIDTPTTGSPSNDETQAIQANNLFTLKLEDGKLVQVGEVRGFGATEQIYGTRYVDDMAYVVTFRRTDPLYAIDLSDPVNPTITGELKIPGFSNFLQSIGDGWLVGIGQNADENGVVKGFQVQLFNVSNPEFPTRTSQYEIITSGFSSSHSEAEHESRAFTWYPSRNLLSIPVSTYGDDGYFSGLLVMKITPEDGDDAIVEIGRVDHSALANPNDDGSPNYYYWAPQMRRSAFSDDYLFAISHQGVSVSHIDDLNDLLFEMPFDGN